MNSIVNERFGRLARYRPAISRLASNVLTERNIEQHFPLFWLVVFSAGLGYLYDVPWYVVASVVGALFAMRTAWRIRKRRTVSQDLRDYPD